MALITGNRKLERQTNHSKREPHKVVRREIHVQPARQLDRGTRDARLQEVEDRLLAKMIATHANREHALDRLLHDVLDERNLETTSRTLPLKGDACISRRLRRTEDLLVAAVIENHPNAEKAVDRLLEDLLPERTDSSIGEWDNDWDGMA
jgi:acetyl/propionyl-CoA carboxylase alpha subunit